MAEETTTAAAETTAETPTETAATTAATGNAEAKSLLDGAPETAEAAKTDAPAAKPEEPAKPRNLMDDEPEKKPDALAAETAEEKPSEEAVKAWTDGIKAIDLGDGVKMNDPLLAAMTPELMKMSGNDPKRAEGVVKAFTAYQQDVMKAVAKRDTEIDNANIAACEKEFGADLKKVVGLARKGGEIAFGSELWKVIRQERKVCNNPAFIRQMAWVAKRFATDSGHVVPKDGTGGGDVGDVLHRMYGSVKV